MSSFYDLLASPNSNNSPNTPPTPNQPINPLVNKNVNPVGVNSQQQQGSSTFNMLKMRQQLNQIPPQQQPPNVQQGSVFSSFTVTQPQPFQIPNQQPVLSQPSLQAISQQSPQSQFPSFNLQPPSQPSPPSLNLFNSPPTPSQPNNPPSLLGPNLNFQVPSQPPSNSIDLPFPPPITAEDDAFGLLSISQSSKVRILFFKNIFRNLIELIKF